MVFNHHHVTKSQEFHGLVQEVTIEPACVAELADDWLPKRHIVVGSLKPFLLVTFHGGSSRYLQEHIDKFAYRFNRYR